ncbi:MAG TPA: KGG domain-containing protein [Gemmatimonadaceae bacterium]|nr:KGG domain-containing protein [Gemmatimonadaceae bacterium]
MPNRPGNDDRITAGGIGSNGGSANSSQNGNSRSRSNRGFASMDREKQREIASKGGRAAHAKGTAHEFDSGEAREAGRKGGMAVSRNREHMAAIGRRGGEARGQARTRTTSQVNSGGAGSNAEGGFQNSRAGSNGADRQVAIDTNSDGVTGNTQGTRGGNSSLGGERRTNVGGNEASSGSETFGNH